MAEGEKIRIDADRAAWRRVEGETVVLDLQTSSYLSVNESGTVLWPLLEEGASQEQLTEALLGEFEVDEQTAARDAQDFVNALRARGLLLGD